MLEKALIVEVNIPCMKTKYEITKEAHAHLLCQSCSDFIDIDLNITPLLEEAQAKSDYTITTSNIILSGICQKCKDKE